jgi:hypothetical protein
MIKENEYKAFVVNQKLLLNREFNEKKLLTESKKRLKAITKEINKNNEFLRKS